jgi:hypothetical protein
MQRGAKSAGQNRKAPPRNRRNKSGGSPVYPSSFAFPSAFPFPPSALFPPSAFFR